jgi:transposase
VVGALAAKIIAAEGACVMGKRRYTRQFKDEACKLVSEGQYEPAVAAKELGMPEMTLRSWLNRRGWRGPRQAPDSDDPAVLKARLRDLEARLRRSEMEKEILKKATAFFASQNP